MNKKSTSIFLLIISCLLMTCASAQGQEKSANSNEEDLEWWVHDYANPNNEGLLIKALWFEDQNPRSSDRLEVYCTGRTYQARSSIMGTGPSGSTILNPQQVANIKQILSDLQPPVIPDVKGQTHTAVILLGNGNYVRHDYRGTSMPDFVRKIKGIIEAGIPEPWPPFDKVIDPRLLSAPEDLRSCVAENKNIDLETLPKDELLKRAFRRYVYFSERYRILKIYFKRFPAETDDITKMLKRWVAAYEKAQK